MKKANELNRRSFSNFGISTILITFVLLCIVTFCALGLLTASSDYRLSKKTAARTDQYYAAEKKAYEKIADTDQLLNQCYTNSVSRKSYMHNAKQALKAYAKKENCFSENTNDPLSGTYRIEISERSSLVVTFLVCYPPDSGGVFYELTSWKTVTDIPETKETPLKLFGT